MKSYVDSKLLLGLLIGSAVGAAIGYLAATDKKDQIVDELSSFVGKIKEGFNATVNKYKEKAQKAAGTTVEDAEVAE
ncbi:MAG: YtxH domain-containing protein [Tannerella sp.]|jgi:gas vesicle protein|nr:YtxH domain-containing protein [Tannerella sp.]